ncbi:energy transducer TonB [bacterium]|nr:energy transducer TonB [bacterium]
MQNRKSYALLISCALHAALLLAFFPTRTIHIPKGPEVIGPVTVRILGEATESASQTLPAPAVQAASPKPATIKSPIDAQTQTSPPNTSPVKGKTGTAPLGAAGPLIPAGNPAQTQTAASEKPAATGPANTTGSATSTPGSLPGDRGTATVLKRVSPIYPKTALNQGLEGRVVVEVNVSDQGEIESLTVVQSSGHSILDNAFVSTIKKYYRFEPKRVMGIDVASKIRVDYTFEIDNK